MRSPEIRQKAARHSYESRVRLGLHEAWKAKVHSPEARAKHQSTINRKKTVVRTEGFRGWYTGEKFKNIITGLIVQSVIT